MAPISEPHTIAGALTFSEGPSRLVRAELAHPSGARAAVTLHGGHVVSWMDGAGRNRLFVSDKAEYAADRAIRGGIPVLFPQFGKFGPLKPHGFARTQSWAVTESSREINDDISLSLTLTDSEVTREIWPHRFAITQKLTLSSSLRSEVTVVNTSESPISFTFGFHTYFSVSDIESVSIDGLGGLEYLDNLQGLARCREEHRVVRVSSEIDRVYLDVPSSVTMSDIGTRWETVIEKENLPDVVVWNPWIEKSKGMSDLEPDDYRRFVCIETGAIERPVILGPGESWVAVQNLR